MAVTRITDHIENLRAKPAHVRERIAIGTTVGITAIVALFWVAALATSGSLSLTPTTVASSDAGSADGAGPSSLSQLLGAAGSAFTGGGASTTPTPNIIETSSSSTVGTQSSAVNRTVIPF